MRCRLRGARLSRSTHAPLLIRCSSSYLRIGLELSLYADCEVESVLWYMNNVLTLWLQNYHFSQAEMLSSPCLR